ncbi:hypothetical protein LPUS_11156 [Lasallia pustulata]|uniref:Rhodopsin domain-containing protein n=1 Tax=Lasallia pustulata TaxID=136370 RepID=A0A1W5DBG8_9LECA|nr:hypothetical protein LPUS_11156 [Lasallia pustulata]
MDVSHRPSVLLGVLWSLCGLGTSFTAARFYSRMVLEPAMGWDDWSMLAALVLNYAAFGIATASVHHGLGTHQNTLSPSDVRYALEFQWVYQAFVVFSLTLSRVSVSILLIRLFPRKTYMKWTLIILAAVNAIAAVLGVTLIFTQCSPTQKLWDHGIKGGHCISPSVQKDIGLWKASLSAASDLLTAVWPIAIVATLHMKPRIKWLLGTLFALTLVAMIACIVQAYYLSLNTVRNDQTFVAAVVVFWVGINSNVMIIVGNIPPLATLYKRFIGGPASRGTEWSSNQQYSFKLKENHNRINSSQDSNVVIIEAPVGARTRTPSEEYIVDAPGQHREEGSRIERRTDISVTYDAT